MCNSLKSVLTALPVPLLFLLAPTAATTIGTARDEAVRDPAPASPSAGGDAAAPWDVRPPIQDRRPYLRRVGDAGVLLPARSIAPAEPTKESRPFRGLIGNFDEACGPFA